MLPAGRPVRICHRPRTRGRRRYSDAVTSPQRPPSVRPVEYKGEALDAERGPGLGCFWFQLGLLLVLVVLTPLTVAWGWEPAISVALLFATIILLLFAGQTVIFLLRLVAADRREGARHAPRSSATPTVGQLEDAGSVDDLGRPLAEADEPAHEGAPAGGTKPVRGVAPAGGTELQVPPATGPSTTPTGDAPGSDQPPDPGVRE